MSDTASLALREQFATPEQQRETASFGMWVFIVTEIMLFGGLFTAFTVYHLSFPQAFETGSSEMDGILGAINTAVLICSSFTMAMAVWSAEAGRQKALSLFLLATMLIGGVFLGIKFFEYYKHYEEHKAPGFWFEAEGPAAPQLQLFYVFYFVMTALHAVHMLVGLGVLSVLLVRSWLGSFTKTYYTPVEVGGLYWHLVDMIWVFLFAIFYIPGLHK